MKRFGLAGVLAVAILLALVMIGQADSPPTQGELDFAHGAMDRLQSELFAALLNEFAGTTPENQLQGKLAIGIIFDDRNTGMRLVGWPIGPVGWRQRSPQRRL